MKLIVKKAIKLGCKVQDKKEAIVQAGELLHEAGYVTSVYIQSMLDREKITSTYLDNGIAIPHGRENAKSEIYHTGLSVTQYPDGIEWEPGKRVHLVVGIAATDNEHMNILMNLAEIAENVDATKAMVQTDNPDEIIERLSRPITY